MGYLNEDEDTRVFRNRIEVHAYFWLVASLIWTIVCLFMWVFSESHVGQSFNGVIILSLIALCFAIATCRWRTVSWVLFIALAQYPLATFVVAVLLYGSRVMYR